MAAERSSVGDEMNRVQLLHDPVKLRGVPQQGVGFFSVYYTVFRGRGVILTSSATGSGAQYPLYASINAFFTATSALYLGCEDGTATGAHIEAAVMSPTVMALEAVCGDPERRSINVWSTALIHSLSRVMSMGSTSMLPTKDSADFRIEIPGSDDGVVAKRDRDLVVHHLDDLFPPAPTPESAKKLASFVNDVKTASARLMLGGFYVLLAPAHYNGIDLLLSAVTATAAPLTYVGMLLYMSTATQQQLPLWVFRIEPMNPSSLESQLAIAQSRLTRYPPLLQTVVKDAMPASSDMGNLRSATFEDVLAMRVTPTHTLNSLFRQASGFYPREVLNMIGGSQPNFTSTLDKVRALTNPKIQVKIITELLYDLALASQRRCRTLRVPTMHP